MTDPIRISFRDAKAALINISTVVERRGYRLLTAHDGRPALGVSVADPDRRLDVLTAPRRLRDLTEAKPFPAILSAA